MRVLLHCAKRHVAMALGRSIPPHASTQGLYRTPSFHLVLTCAIPTMSRVPSRSGATPHPSPDPPPSRSKWLKAPPPAVEVGSGNAGEGHAAGPPVAGRRAGGGGGGGGGVGGGGGGGGGASGRGGSMLRNSLLDPVHENQEMSDLSASTIPPAVYCFIEEETITHPATRLSSCVREYAGWDAPSIIPPAF